MLGRLTVVYMYVEWPVREGNGSSTVCSTECAYIFIVVKYFITRDETMEEEEGVK